MRLPKCCEREMQVVYETTKFFESHCNICGDVVYVKKEITSKPQMLDD